MTDNFDDIIYSLKEKVSNLGGNTYEEKSKFNFNFFSNFNLDLKSPIFYIPIIFLISGLVLFLIRPPFILKTIVNEENETIKKFSLPKFLISIIIIGGLISFSYYYFKT